MITASFVATMARYNEWQNRSIYGAAGTLDDAGRRADRGAFFGSIHRTLSHILWADAMWMSRFDGWEVPPGGIPDSPGMVEDWDDLVKRRAEADARILDWSGRVGDDTLGGELRWFSRAVNREVARPMEVCVTHFFNHQTHHRGQVHAMLTAAGARPDDTDLFIMPAGPGA